MTEHEQQQEIARLRQALREIAAAAATLAAGAQQPPNAELLQVEAQARAALGGGR